MLTPREHSFLTPDAFDSLRTFKHVCRTAGLPVERDGWGLLHCTDAQGQRITVATRDIEYLRLFASGPAAALADPEVPEGKFGWRRDGWPDDWA